MSRNKKFVIAYSIENQDVAKSIDEQLSHAGYKFEHLSSNQTTLLESLGDQLISRETNTILLVSDNFLKGVRCMKNGLEFIQRLANTGKLLPIVIDGKYPIDGGKEFEFVPTAFDRVSHIIKYMNFWQEQYLELRKRKRNISATEEPEFNHKLSIVRGISSNIGEFLRYLRSVKHYSYSEFYADSYKAFFNYTNNQDQHEAFHDWMIKQGIQVKVNEKEPVLESSGNNLIQEESVSTDDQNLIDLITSSSKDILEENGVVEEENLEPTISNGAIIDSNEEIINHEEPPVELTQIPGMDLLNGINGKEENGAKIIEIGADNTEEEAPVIEESIIEIERQTVAEDLSFLNESEVFEKEGSKVFEMDLDELSNLENEESNPEEESVDSILDEVLNQEIIREDIAETEEEYADLNVIFGEQPSLEKISKESNETSKVTPESADNELIEEILSKENNDFFNSESSESFEEKILDDGFDEIVSGVEVETVIEEETSTQIEDKMNEEDVIDDGSDATINENEEEKVEMEVAADQEEAKTSTWTVFDASQKFKEGEFDEGIEIMKSLVTENPTDIYIRYQYAFHLAKFGNDYIGATQELETLLSFNDRHEDSYFLLAELAELHGDNLLAKNYYEKVEDLNSNYPNVYYRLGLLLLNKFENKQKEALHYLKLAVKQNKKNADANYRLGILLNEEFGKHWKAIKYFKKTLKSQKDHPFANYDLAVLYHRLGDRGLANEYYQKAIKINPELQTDRNDEAFKYALIDNSVNEESIFSNLMNQEEDPEYTELKKDMARLEAKMAELNQPENEESSKTERISEEELTAILEEDTEVVEKISNEEDQLVEEDSTEKEEIPEKVILQPEPEEKKEPIDLGKIVLITGATAGIGKATAEVFAQNGYSVILTGRRSDRLEEFKAKLEEECNSNVQILPFDVRDLEATNEAFDSLPDEWKQVDILINNAGLAKGMAPIHEGDFDLWNQMIDTNLKGLLHVTRAVTPHMVKRSTGHVINIGSTSGRDVYPNGNVYCASKFAVDGLTKAMRHDLYKHNIRVSQVLPAHAETEFALVRFDGDEEKAKMYEDFEPLKPEDIAQSVYFIATQPPHVNISDIVLWSTQQLSPTTINRSGRIYDKK